MFQFGTKLKRLFSRTPRTPTLTPTVAVEARPIILNPSRREQLVRNAARVSRLRQAISTATRPEYKASLQSELDRRLAAMRAAGIKEEV